MPFVIGAVAGVVGRAVAGRALGGVVGGAVARGALRANARRLIAEELAGAAAQTLAQQALEWRHCPAGFVRSAVVGAAAGYAGRQLFRGAYVRRRALRLSRRRVGGAAGSQGVMAAPPVEPLFTTSRMIVVVGGSVPRRLNSWPVQYAARRRGVYQGKVITG